MNILEAFIKKNKKIIILITGINIKSINKIGDILGKDLSLPVLKINEIIEKDYYKSFDDISLDKLNIIINKNKSFILCGFINPLLKLNIDFSINLKYDANFFKENKIEDSKIIYDFYKNNLKNKPVNKFIKFENDEDSVVNIIFDFLMKFISDNLYNSKSIFNKTYDNTKIKAGYKQQKVFDDIYDRKIKKKPFKWDKEDQYVDIDKYNDKMHDIEIYSENKKEIDNDIFKEMEDSSYSPEEKYYFVKDFFFKNYKGGGKKEINYSSGIRYIID